MAKKCGPLLLQIHNPPVTIWHLRSILKSKFWVKRDRVHDWIWGLANNTNQPRKEGSNFPTSNFPIILALGHICGVSSSPPFSPRPQLVHLSLHLMTLFCAFHCVTLGYFPVISGGRISWISDELLYFTPCDQTWPTTHMYAWVLI